MPKLQLGKNKDGKWSLVDENKQEIGQYATREEGVAALRAATPAKEKTGCKHAELNSESLAMMTSGPDTYDVQPGYPLPVCHWYYGHFCHRCKNIVFSGSQVGNKVIELTRDEYRSIWVENGHSVPPTIEDIIATKH